MHKKNNHKCFMFLSLFFYFTELPLIHAYLNCTNESTILVEAGCEIANKRCKCWPERKLCRDDGVYTDIRWHFKTLEVSISFPLRFQLGKLFSMGWLDFVFLKWKS